LGLDSLSFLVFHKALETSHLGLEFSDLLHEDPC
jgi:hypothetical protein